MVSEPGDGVPSNPWGTGLRVEYYSLVRRRLHCLVGVLFTINEGRNGFQTGRWKKWSNVGGETRRSKIGTRLGKCHFCIFLLFLLVLLRHRPPTSIDLIP